MIDESAAVLPIWMLISAAFGFMLGEALGGQARVRKYLEQANDDLREQLQAARPGTHRPCQTPHTGRTRPLEASFDRSHIRMASSARRLVIEAAYPL